MTYSSLVITPSPCCDVPLSCFGEAAQMHSQQLFYTQTGNACQIKFSSFFNKISGHEACREKRCDILRRRVSRFMKHE